MSAYDHWLNNKAYLSAMTVTNISQRVFTCKMAAKINWYCMVRNKSSISVVSFCGGKVHFFYKKTPPFHFLTPPPPILFPAYGPEPRLVLHIKRNLPWYTRIWQWAGTARHWHLPIGNESVPKIIINITINSFLNCHLHFGNSKPQQFPSAVW